MKKPIFVELVFLIPLNLKKHPSGPEDDDTMRLKSKFYATDRAAFY